MISLKKKVLFSFFLLSHGMLCLLTGCADQGADAVQRQSIFAMDTMFSMTAVTEDTSLLSDCAAMLQQLSHDLDHRQADSLLTDLHTKRSLTCPDDTLPRLLRETAALQASYGTAVQLTCKPLTDLWGIATDTPYLPTDEEILAAKSRINDAHITVSGNTVTLADGALLELGAVAKGYALDRLAERLQQGNTAYAVVSASSAVMLYGQKPDGTPFTLQITDPADGGILGTVTIGHDSPQQITMVGTSGGYARYSEINGTRYSHVMDLETGAPTTSDLASVTVICQNGLMADFLSTTLYLGGTDGLTSITDNNWMYLAVDRKGDCFYSPQLEFTKGTVTPA